MKARHAVIVTLSAAAVVLQLVGCASADGARTPADTRSGTTAVGLPVEGYLEATSGAAKYVNRDASGLALVGVDGVNLTREGNALTAAPQEAAPIVAAARARGIKTELLVGNFDANINDFSPSIATKLLVSSANRSAVIRSIVSKVAQGRYDGVQLDFESLDSSHGAGLSAFVSELCTALPASKSVSMALMATDTAAGYTAEGYQLSSLARSADRFVLMAYDQHGPTWTSAGPIGGTPWVTSVLRALIASGAPKAKIDLGVAEYAYTWPGDGSDGVQLSVADARARAGSAAEFDSGQGEWTAKLPDGTVIWWSDSRTFAERKALAARYGLHGLAIWELSLGDPMR